MSLILLGSPLSPTPPGGGPSGDEYRHARSGVCEVGTAISGLVNYRLRLTVNDVPVGMLISSGFRIDLYVGRSSTLTFSTLTPVEEGQQVKIIDDGAHHLLFGGTIDTVEFSKEGNSPIIYNVACTDWIWLANKNTEIYETFLNVGANTAVTKILEYVDPGIGIMPGSIPESLGTVTMTIDGSNFEEALNDIAKAVRAHWKLTAHRRVDIFQTEVPTANSLSLVNDTKVKLLGFHKQLSQIRTRVTGVGGGSQTDGITLAGSTTINVKEIGWYDPAGGQLRISGITPFTYTGIIGSSGSGTITGVSGLTRDLIDGENVNLYVTLNDIPAQTDLAARLGAGLSGIALYRFSDERLSLSELTSRCQMYLDFFKTPITQVSYSMGMPDFYYNSQRRWEIGRLVPVTIPTPTGDIGGTLRLSEMTIEGLADVVMPDGTGSSWETQRNIVLRPGARQGIFDLMVGEG